MASSPGKAYTLIRNLRLTASWPVILAFGINPPAAIYLFYYSVRYQTEDRLLPIYWQILLPLLYGILSGSLIPALAMNHEVKRLERLGYERRKSVPWQVQFLFGGVWVGFYYGVRPLGEQAMGTGSSWLMTSFMVALPFAMWMLVVLAYMGPIWWFTERVEHEQ